MKKIGIIGGMAWPSTIAYYRYICNATCDHFKQQGYEPPYPIPEMVIESVNLFEQRKLRGTNQADGSWDHYEEFFKNKFLSLKQAGADFGFIASNTPHQRLEGIKKDLDFDVLSILETTAQKVIELNSTSALILGTKVTMEGEGYCRQLKKSGIEAVNVTEKEDLDTLDRLIDEQLTAGDINGAQELMMSIAHKYIQDKKGAVICLACTELPLAFPNHTDRQSFKLDDLCFINTTITHAHKAFEKAVVEE